MRPAFGSAIYRKIPVMKNSAFLVTPALALGAYALCRRVGTNA